MKVSKVMGSNFDFYDDIVTGLSGQVDVTEEQVTAIEHAVNCHDRLVELAKAGVCYNDMYEEVSEYLQEIGEW